MTLEPVARAAWRAVAAIKNAFVSNRSRDLTVLAGPARGAVLHTNLSKGTRELLGLYEAELIPYVKGYVRPGNVCYDVGAAGGYYAFAFARLAAPGEVHCFETEPAAAAELRTLADRNAHLGSRIVVHHAQVGASDRDAGITSLDTVVYHRRYPAPNVIKIDAEGAEVDILHGAARLLREHRPRLLIEVHSQELEDECDRLLTQAGYQTTVVHNRELMAEHNFRQGHNRWLCAQ
jgi:hypothetical protein